METRERQSQWGERERGMVCAHCGHRVAMHTIRQAVRVNRWHWIIRECRNCNCQDMDA